MLCQGAMGNGFSGDAGSIFTLLLPVLGGGWGGYEAPPKLSGSPSPFSAPCQDRAATWATKLLAAKV